MTATRVLVIEDNDMNQILIKDLLELEGFQVTVAANAEIGIQRAHEFLPQLILMDIQLPGMDGLSATKIIASDPDLQSIPVVALTSYAMRGDEEKAKRAGCCGYITKPIDTRSFGETITGSDKHRLTAADSGAACLQLLQDESPDLILLDIMMPEMNGYEVCLKIKSNPATASIPVLFITALTEPDDKVKGFEVGAVDFITKPFDDSELFARIGTHLALKHAQDALNNQNRVLDEQVRARTVELVKSNEMLKKEIAHRKQAQEMLQVSEAKSRAIVEALPDSVFEISREGIILSCKGSVGHLHLSPESIIGQSAYQVFPSEIADKTIRTIQATLKSGITQIYEYELPAKNERRTYESRMVKIASSEVLAITRDITEQKQAEAALREREERLRQENLQLKSAIRERCQFGNIIGKSRPMQTVYNLIMEAASSDASVVIYGESGTGKELVARAIHDMGPRRHHTFVPVNCGAIPENLLESEFFGYRKGAFTGATADNEGFLDAAQKGTLFLDEVGEISTNMQVKLLRAIDGGGFTPVGGNLWKQPDVRFIAASNRDLAELVGEGKMREDFFYRLHILPIQLPPLRERKEDLPLLIEHFMKLYAAGNGNASVDKELVDAMLCYDWPGNVRELQNTLHRFVTLKKLDFMAVSRHKPDGQDEDSGAEVTDALDYWSSIIEFEKKLISRALEQNRWHREKAAASLGLPRRTFFRKLKKLGLTQA